MSKIQKGEFPYGHFFKMISGKWKPYILVAIDYEGCIRFNSILKFWGGDLQQSTVSESQGTGRRSTDLPFYRSGKKTACRVSPVGKRKKNHARHQIHLQIFYR